MVLGCQIQCTRASDIPTLPRVSVRSNKQLARVWALKRLSILRHSGKRKRPRPVPVEPIGWGLRGAASFGLWRVEASGFSLPSH